MLRTFCQLCCILRLTDGDTGDDSAPNVYERRVIDKVFCRIVSSSSVAGAVPSDSSVTSDSSDSKVHEAVASDVSEPLSSGFHATDHLLLKRPAFPHIMVGLTESADFSLKFSTQWVLRIFLFFKFYPPGSPEF